MAVLGGCAHPINVEPDLGRIPATTGQPLPIKVGYCPTIWSIWK
ncbi:hypothetical protein [Pseudaquabacterium pictum]|nr:hypothetical protein [Rubrivivax pictus]